MELTALHALHALAVTASEGGADVYKIFVEVFTTMAAFLIVLGILKKYAFGPILSVIDERREKIQADLDRAESLRDEAADERAQLNERLRNIEDEARAKMQEAIAEGRRIAQTIQDNAQNEAREILEKARQNIQFETEKARVELKNDIINMTVEATERLIRERLDDEKHRELIGNFIEQIERN